MRSTIAGRTHIVILLGLLVLSAPALCLGQEYPTRPINLTVAIAPGGTVDISSRILAAKAEKFLGQPIAVNNNGGGAGTVALGILAKQKPDGYQIATCPETPLIEVPQLRAVPYRPDDLAPIMQYAEPDSGIVVRADSPFKTFKDLVEYARKNPGKVTYTISGSLNPMHLAMMYVGKEERIEWTAIPVPGGDPNMPLLGGHVTGFSASSSWKQYVDQGKFRLLATYGEKRMAAFPNVPTLKDLGYNFAAHIFYLAVAPKGTPAAVIAKLDSAFRKAIDDPEFIAYMKKAEIPIVYQNSGDTKKHLEDAYTRFGKMIVDLKLPKEQ